MIVTVVIGVLGLFILLVIGAVVANATTFPIIPPGENTNETECENACQQLRDRRIDKCDIQQTTNAADIRAKGYRNAWIVAQLAATAAAAAVVAATVSVFSLPAVPVLSIIAAGLQALATIALGAYLTALAELENSNRNLMDAINKETEAIRIVRSKCTGEKASACINNLPAC